MIPYEILDHLCDLGSKISWANIRKQERLHEKPQSYQAWCHLKINLNSIPCLFWIISRSHLREVSFSNLRKKKKKLHFLTTLSLWAMNTRCRFRTVKYRMVAVARGPSLNCLFGMWNQVFQNHTKIEKPKGLKAFYCEDAALWNMHSKSRCMQLQFNKVWLSSPSRSLIGVQNVARAH